MEQFATTGRRGAEQITRARILLKAACNQSGGGWLDQEIATALDVGVATVERMRRRFVEMGLAASLVRRPGRGCKQYKLNGEQEAHLIALSCSEPPTGRARWTLRLLAEKMVQLGYVEAVSHETVRQTLKKPTATLEAGLLGNSAPAECGICLSNGVGARGLSTPLRS